MTEVDTVAYFLPNARINTTVHLSALCIISKPSDRPYCREKTTHAHTLSIYHKQKDIRFQSNSFCLYFMEHCMYGAHARLFSLPWLFSDSMNNSWDSGSGLNASSRKTKVRMYHKPPQGLSANKHKMPSFKIHRFWICRRRVAINKHMYSVDCHKGWT